MRGTKHPVETLEKLVAAAVPRVSVLVDRPINDDGHWFVSFTVNDRTTVGEWRQKHGFGVSLLTDETSYGEGPDEVFSNVEDAAKRVVELLGATRVID